MSSEVAALTSGQKTELEFNKLSKEVEKLSLEIKAMRDSTGWDRAVGRYLPLVTTLLAIGGFLFGIRQYVDENKRTNDENKRTNDQLVVAAEARGNELKGEAAKPFWDSQLKLYIQAANAASIVATTSDAKKREDAEAEFWALYWGPLSCVEDIGIEKSREPEVANAMVEFGKYLKGHPDAGSRDASYMQRLSLTLAHAMRKAIAPSFKLEFTPRQ